LLAFTKDARICFSVKEFMGYRLPVVRRPPAGIGRRQGVHDGASVTDTFGSPGRRAAGQGTMPRPPSDVRPQRATVEAVRAECCRA
jgi:hypothetical protein